MIPGWIAALATFPGIIFHEIAHVLFCRLLGVRVRKACYFRLGDPAGYVLHDTPETAYQSIIISAGPFFFNSAAGALAASTVAIPAIRPHTGGPLHYVLIWLGVSIAMHAFPSTGDARAMWRAVWSRRSPLPAKLIGTPLVLLIYGGALGSVIWLDLAYGIAVVILLPRVAAGLFA